MKSMMSNEKEKERVLQEWLDSVHFGSCCRDPVDDKGSDSTKNKETNSSI